MSTADFQYVYIVHYDGNTLTIQPGDITGAADDILTDNIPNGPTDNPNILGDVFEDTFYGHLSGDVFNGQDGTYFGLASNAFNNSTGILAGAGNTIYYATNQEITDFTAGHANLDFQLAPYTICFMRGTMIRTPEGELPVESLKPGDSVATTDGRAVPVRWVGRQTIHMTFADPIRVAPIRIKAGALDENVPARDLLLSPDHAILVDGVLIQAGALVNGVSIVRETDVPEVFTYYHVEVDDHSLIMAQNVPAETFVDNVDRLAFDNWAEHEALYPNGRSIAEMDFPRAKASRQVPRSIRERLSERSGRLFGGPTQTAA